MLTIPLQVQVLYAHPTLLADSTSLQHVADEVCYAIVSTLLAQPYLFAGLLAWQVLACFVDAGLMEPGNRSVKLHVTVVKTRAGQGACKFCVRFEIVLTVLLAGNKGGRPTPRASFDASVLFEQLQAFNFGTSHLRELHLSQMQRTGDQFYGAEAKLAL